MSHRGDQQAFGIRVLWTWLKNIETWPVLVATRRRQCHIGQLSLGGSSRRAYIKAPVPLPLPRRQPFLSAPAEWPRGRQRTAKRHPRFRISSGRDTSRLASSPADVLRSVSDRAARLAWMNNYQWTAGPRAVPCPSLLPPTTLPRSRWTPFAIGFFLGLSPEVVRRSTSPVLVSIIHPHWCHFQFQSNFDCPICEKCLSDGFYENIRLDVFTDLNRYNSGII